MKKKVKKLAALVLSGIVIAGGTGIYVNAANQNGIFEMPAPKASASGTTPNSVKWTANLSRSSGSATASTSCNPTSRVVASLTVEYRVGSTTYTKSGTGSGQGYGSTEVSVSGTTIKATSSHSLESFYLTTLSE